MRHRNSGVKLGRTSSHRKAMFQNMANSLFEHELIKTTLPKAKELRRVAEPLITLAKNDTVANRRLAFARTRNAAIVGKLFTELARHRRVRLWRRNPARWSARWWGRRGCCWSRGGLLASAERAQPADQ